MGQIQSLISMTMLFIANLLPVAAVHPPCLKPEWYEWLVPSACLLVDQYISLSSVVTTVETDS